MIGYSGHHKIVEKYMGYEIVLLTCRKGYADYYFISKNNTRISSLALNSVKAAKTCIDTYLRANAQNQKPIYK